jgi:hypothetical protein
VIAMRITQKNTAGIWARRRKEIANNGAYVAHYPGRIEAKVAVPNKRIGDDELHGNVI